MKTTAEQRKVWRESDGAYLNARDAKMLLDDFEEVTTKQAHEIQQLREELAQADSARLYAQSETLCKDKQVEALRINEASTTDTENKLPSEIQIPTAN
jgi:hypothetical protein